MNHVHVGSAVSGSGPTQAQYGGTNQPPPTHPGSTPGTLPFTGFDIGLLFAAGIVLAAAGYWIRRASWTS